MLVRTRRTYRHACRHVHTPVCRHALVRPRSVYGHAHVQVYRHEQTQTHMRIDMYSDRCTGMYTEICIQDRQYIPIDMRTDKCTFRQHREYRQTDPVAITI